MLRKGNEMGNVEWGMSNGECYGMSNVECRMGNGECYGMSNVEWGMLNIEY